MTFSEAFVVAMATYMLVAAQLILSAIASNASMQSSKWQRLQWRCLSESLALTRAKTDSKIECTAIASSSFNDGDIVAEWNSDTGVCSVYDYTNVNRIAVAATSTAACAVYRKLRDVSEFVLSLSQKFVAAWVFGADANTHNLVNRVGDSQKNRLHPVNIEWTVDGAAFNGVDSYMLLNDSEYMSFSSGFTWLLRLKRQPGPQVFLEFVKCSDFAKFAGHFWEFLTANQLYYEGTIASETAHSRKISNTGSSLTNDANAWMNIGVTISVTENTINLFVDNQFLSDDKVTRGSVTGTPVSPVCLLLGRKHNLNYLLKGTVRAVGIANASMTETEIRQFFSKLPTV